MGLRVREFLSRCLGMHPPLGVNLISYVSGNLGIGVTARNIAQLLLDRGHPLAILDVFPGEDRCVRNKAFSEHIVGRLEDCPHPVNLLVHPPADLGSLFERLLPLLRDPERLNAGFCMWEVPSIPKLHLNVLQSLDVLVAESRYIQEIFETRCSGVPVLFAHHPLYLPAPAGADRARYGLPDNAVVFLASFDPQSDSVRKNPLAVVRAFLMALRGEERAHLVIKMHNCAVAGAELPIVEAIRQAAAGHPRVHVLAKHLSYPYLLGLYSCCDVFVSLHRAEGLGLGPMEAMALGKCVIATGFSGNMTYMDNTNACLVGYRLIPAEGEIPVYRELARDGAVWADPDEDQAARWMRRLYSDPDLRASIGRKAQRDLMAFHSQATDARFVDELETLWRDREVFSLSRTRKRMMFDALRPVAP